MAQTISTKYAEQLDNPLRIPRAYLYNTNDQTYIYDDTDLISFKVIANMSKEGFIFGNAIGRYAEIIIRNPNNNTYDWLNDNVEIYTGLTIDIGQVSETVEYIKQGTYLVTNIEKFTDKETLRLECFDSMARLNAPYEYSETTLGLTLAQFAEQIAGEVGIVYKSNAFTNHDYVLTSVPNVISGDRTLRQVIAWIAELAGGNAYITRDNELLISNFGASSVFTITPDLYFDQKIEPTFGPIDYVIMAREPLNDNISYPSVITTEVLPYKLVNNWVGDAQREDLIDNVYTAVNGFTYAPYYLKWRSTGHLDYLDKITIEDTNANTVTSYVGNKVLVFDGSLYEELSLSAYTPGETAINNRGLLNTKVRRVEAQVDSINGQISLITSDINGLEESNASLVVSIGQIGASVETLSDEVGSVRADLTLTDSELNLAFTNIAEQKSYYNFTEDRLTIGKDGSPAQIIIDIEAQPYITLGDGIDVATISSKTMQITDVEVLNSIIFGSHKIKSYTTGGTTYTIVQKV